MKPLVLERCRSDVWQHSPAWDRHPAIIPARFGDRLGFPLSHYG